MNTMQKVRAWLPPTFPHRLGGDNIACARCLSVRMPEIAEFPLPLQTGLPPAEFELAPEMTSTSLIDLPGHVPESYWGTLDVEPQECSALTGNKISAQVKFATVILPTGKRLELRHTADFYLHRQGISQMNRVTNNISVWERHLDTRVVLLAQASKHMASSSESDAQRYIARAFQTHNVFSTEAERVREKTEAEYARGFVSALGIDRDNHEALDHVIGLGNYLSLDENSHEVFIAKTMHGDLER